MCGRVVLVKPVQDKKSAGQVTPSPCPSPQRPSHLSQGWSKVAAGEARVSFPHFTVKRCTLAGDRRTFRLLEMKHHSSVSPSKHNTSSHR